jgi:acetyl-CoA decarbonylase/synthase complex subunit delta
MPFKPNPQKFTAKINALTIGAGDQAITIGGENSLPFYTFDAPTVNAPRVGLEVSDRGVPNISGVQAFYAGAESFADRTAKACTAPGVDFIALSFDGAHPDNGNRPIAECVELAKAAAAVATKPLIVVGSKNVDKDAELFQKLAEALDGLNVLFLSAREENYKAVSAGAVLAYGQKIGAESAVDINLAKQLNVLISQMGVKGESVAMNVGSAAAGYGFEYVATTMDRVKAAALAQDDNMLQMPIITPVGSEAWSVKESIVSEEDFPDWGSAEERGIHMEIATAAAVLAAGSNAVILRHPESAATVSTLIAELA